MVTVSKNVSRIARANSLIELNFRLVAYIHEYEYLHKSVALTQKNWRGMKP